MPQYKYTKPQGYFKADLLMDEIIAGLGVVPYLEGSSDGHSVYITLPDSVDRAALDRLIDVHDAGKSSGAERRMAQHAAALKQLGMASPAELARRAAEAKSLEALRAEVAALARLAGHLMVALGYNRPGKQEG